MFLFVRGGSLSVCRADITTCPDAAEKQQSVSGLTSLLGLEVGEQNDSVSSSLHWLYTTLPLLVLM